MRFSKKNPAAEAFVSRFVHASVPAGSDGHERHRCFLTTCGVASGLGLGVVPLLIAGNQAQPSQWAGVAAVAAVPFFLAVAVSRIGRLETIMNLTAVLISTLMGTLLAISGIAISGQHSIPLLLIAILACFEPVLWRMQRPARSAVVMALITATVVLFGISFNTGVQKVDLWGGIAPAVLWCGATIYAAFTLFRVAHAIARAESAGIRNKERYELLASNMGEMVCVHDRDGKSTFVSPTGHSIAGSVPEDLLGEKFIERVHLQDRIVFLKAISDVWHSKLDQKTRIRLRRRNAGGHAWAWVETKLRVQLSAKGVVKSVVAVSRDISLEVERHAQQALEKERAQNSRSAQKRFIATMSHELRTPLNAIIGFADVLEQELFGKLEQDRHRDYVSHIHTSGQHLLQVVNDLLDMSRLDANRYELQLSEFALTDVVDATLAMMTPLATKAGVALVRETNDNYSSVMRGDRRSCQQMLINLVSNAIKFTPEGGTVRLTARQFGRNVRIMVRDTGVGIDAAFLKSIGQPFMQAESGPDRRFEGSGLGLSVVKGLVELHSGSFEIESTPGRGTTATIILPVQPAIARPVPRNEDVRVVNLPDSAAVGETHAKPNSSVASRGDSHVRVSA